MKREIVAILPRRPVSGTMARSPLPEGTAAVDAGDWTVILSLGRKAAVFGRALRRQRVADAPRRMRQLEQLMPLGPVLPVVPGTAVADADIAPLVRANADLLTRVCAEARGMVQYQIIVQWRAAEVLHRFRDAPEIEPLFTGSVVTSEAMASAISRLAARMGAEVRAKLAPHANDLAELPTEEAMLCNLVLLTEESRTGRIDRAVESVDALWPEGLHIRQIGPGPVTSFCALRIRRYGPKSLTRARRVLAIDAEATADDVARARAIRLRDADAPADDVRMAARLLTAVATARHPVGHVHILDVHSETARPGPVEAAIA